MNAQKGILISDFTINNLGGYLNNLSDGIITSVIAPFNQVSQVLLDQNSECWQSNPDFAVVFCQPERIFKSFDKLLNNQQVPLKNILDEVDEFIDQLKVCSGRVKFTILASFTTQHAGFTGASAFAADNGVSLVISQINIRLASKLNQTNGFYILDSQPWMKNAGANAYQPKQWYLSKTPFHASVFEAAAKDIIAVIKNIFGAIKKLIVVDLDDTLWGGILGDAGYENLILGGHNALGEAYADFQKALLAVSQKGIQLAIASKNEESIALNAIEKNEGMILRKKDFVAHRINWNDKAQNILDIVTELNIGLNAVVFLDDNPAERARVRETLPDVFVPDMPEDKLLYPSFFKSLNCFNSIQLSKEDSKRTDYYLDEKKRTSDMSNFKSLETWLASIEITIKIDKLSKDNSQRVTQLANKTNQLNLSTKRYTEKEINDLIENQHHLFFAVSYTDRFGDAGLIGILSLKCLNDTAHIENFILSCRVMGRKCEETMLAFAVKQARQHKCKKVVAEYLPTEKNKPCFDFFKKSGFAQNENIFTWDCSENYPLPSYINYTYDV